MSLYKLLDFIWDPGFVQTIKDPRRLLLNVCTTQMMREESFLVDKLRRRDDLFEAMLQIADKEPEFILMTANYLRNHMHVKSATNFILAFAVSYKTTRLFCKEYFNRCVRLPTDLIEICEYAQLMRYYFDFNWVGFTDTYIRIIPYDLNLRKVLNFPKMLQKCAAAKFPEFNQYQLGKYCSDQQRKRVCSKFRECYDQNVWLHRLNLRAFKSLKKQQRYAQMRAKDQKRLNKREKMCLKKIQYKKIRHFRLPKTYCFDRKFLTMKDIIKFCHIYEPKLHVMQILRCKYPKTSEEFGQLFPQRDDLQFDPSLVGKRMTLPKPVTWDRELSKNPKNKDKIWENLILSNQLPYMAMLRNLRNILKANISFKAHDLVLQRINNPKAILDSRLLPMQFFKPMYELQKIVKQAKFVQKSKKDKQQFLVGSEFKVNQKHLEQYVAALEQALHTSTKVLNTISGKTIIFVDCSHSMSIERGTLELQTTAFLLSQILRQKCEYAEYYLYAEPRHNTSAPYLRVNFNDENLLACIEKCLNQLHAFSAAGEQLGWVFEELMLKPKIKYDNVVVLTDMLVEQGFKENNVSLEWLFKEYSKEVNDRVKWFFIDMLGGRMEAKGECQNVFLFSGLSDKLIGYLSEASHDQVNQVYAFNQKKQVMQGGGSQLQFG